MNRLPSPRSFLLPRRTRPRLRAAVGALLLAAGPALLAPPAALAQSAHLPALGDEVSQDFGVGAERRLGDRIMVEIRRDPDYLDDPLLLDYVRSIWQPLLDAARVRGDLSAELDERFAWEAFLVRDRSVNAFALPGGYTGVHLGLIGMTATRDELASVLAHELSHVTQRHIARNMSRSRQQSLVAMASMIVGVLAASRSPDAANAVITGGQALAVQGQLNFSRDMEREADRIGFGLLQQAGFAPTGMASMFERLQQASRHNDSNAFPYLRTHPLTSERIGEARSRLGVEPGARTGAALEHAVMQARARVLMDSRPDALQRWQRPGGAPAEDAAGRLLAAAAQAQASVLLRDWVQADEALARARQLAAPEPRALRAVALLQVQAHLARGETAQAERALAPWRMDGSRTTELLAAQIGVGTRPPADPARLKRTAEDLQTWLSAHPRDSSAWALLGQAWERLDQPVRSVRAQAEARYVLGDLQGAIDRLRAAQRLAQGSASSDHIEASVVDARLRAVESEWRQRQRDEAAGQNG
nr:M48 family metalloprotease [Caldimonas tepidiphila]